MCPTAPLRPLPSFLGVFRRFPIRIPFPVFSNSGVSSRDGDRFALFMSTSAFCLPVPLTVYVPYSGLPSREQRRDNAEVEE